ncbi:MAG: alpha/beta hydrolase [Saprospiraceae bacterium]|nr:alpha/beta hydrolase [Bacteroidia bacterium]NNE16591.1 alpha/beta hydrolase [Saprospiraceae bacterium]NNL91515.1 alpha/beta hydrolase [Saprospiraceae bacterium]
MKYFFTCLILFSLSVAYGQSQRIQYNVIVNNDDDKLQFDYEVVDLDDKSKSTTPRNIDEFLVAFFNDISILPADKNQPLFYIHGMWGGKKFAFNRTYKMMEALYLENEATDIARIISIKWPGNNMEYKVNKATLYEIAPEVTEWFSNFLLKFHMYKYVSKSYNISLDILAHSLGTELTKEILCGINYDNLEYPLIDNLILASPDLVTDVFETTPCFTKNLCMTNETHIYFSERDLTLGVSNNLNKIDRLGRAGPSEKSSIPTNVCFIDVSDVKDETNFSDLMTGHSSFRASPIVSQDILEVLTEQKQHDRVPRSLMNSEKRIYKLVVDEDQ